MIRVGWRRAGRALWRVIVVWAVATLTMLVLAGLLPDFRLQSPHGDSATRVGVTAALGAGGFGLLSALVWPLLVRALLLVPALVLGLLVFFLNGSLLLLALRLNPSGRGEAAFQTAVVVAAAMSAVASATGTALTVHDDEAYRRRLARLAGRHRRPRSGTCPSTPGTVFIQLDGVGHDVLCRAVDEGLMPTIGGWLGRGPATGRNASRGAALTTDPGGPRRATHRLTAWRTDWSSQTGASQLGILHGSNHDIPAFRWYEKDTREVMVSNRPSSAHELQRRAARRTGHAGLLSTDGASRGNLFAGGAGQLALVLSMAARRGPGNRSRAGYFAYFRDPANAVRTAMSFSAEVARELAQSTRARLRGHRPRVGRGGLYPLIRAFATVVERDVVVAAVIGDMLAARTAIYADLVAYDEVAHHSGPYSRDAFKVLQRLDRSLALLAEVAEHAPRAYRFIVLSDHGQSPGETFRGRYGRTLEDLVIDGCGRPQPRRARAVSPQTGPFSGPHGGAEARGAVRAALGRPVEEPAARHRPARRSGPVVLASGNLGLVSFPEVAHRMTRQEIDRRHPGLLATLADHPGVGFVLVADEEHGGVVLGAHGAVLPLSDLDAEPGPLAVFGPHAADAVRRTHTFPHAADIMVNSSFDPATGEVLAFEEQIGSHGGLGGAQSEPFLLSPVALSAPCADGTPPAGAEQVHRVLRRWLAEADRSRAAADHRTPDVRPAARPGSRLPAQRDTGPAADQGRGLTARQD